MLEAQPRVGLFLYEQAATGESWGLSVVLCLSRPPERDQHPAGHSSFLLRHPFNEYIFFSCAGVSGRSFCLLLTSIRFFSGFTPGG